MLQDVSFQSGMILLRKGCVKSDNAVDGILTHACERELKRHSSTVTMETQGSTYSITSLVYGIQGAFVCHPISQFHKVRL